MPITAKNLTAEGQIKNSSAVEQINVQEFKDLRGQQQIQPEKIEKPKKDLSKVIHQSQETKQLPKYVVHEHGELTKKINTKSQYMRDIFDLDS